MFVRADGQHIPTDLEELHTGGTTRLTISFHLLVQQSLTQNVVHYFLDVDLLAPIDSKVGEYVAEEIADVLHLACVGIRLVSRELHYGALQLIAE